ncbi:ThiF family adenylyltransferase [Paenibacillus sp. GSMTC-2017]|uniref:ThiF family adenylyltransferase n=1 Tax=Paenibacillus sp. GSMTC-2017 TaxID=2794350 RepID=UPI0018D8F362|nr:ThiF family adenylyltransferase [Paenibacillus sp. GSMTC-2017]MBH5318532.1 ThiF family adenylyltransferase [Paenibacillus sp. GSMTC-2017]
MEHSEDNHEQTQSFSSSEDYSSSANRYSRQIRYKHIGDKGQAMLGQSRIAIVGMGALGSVIAQHLVRSGIGYVRIIDRDIVEWSNLQRQMLYSEDDASRLLPKAEAAAAHLRAINSSVTIDPISTDLSSHNAETLLAGVDLILDGSDNFSVRYLINDYSLKYAVPWIYGGAVGASGMTMTIIPNETPCYRCLFPDPPPPGTTDTCDTAGVISPIIDMIASLQATEALKLLSGNREALHRTLFQIDLWNHSWLPLNVSHAHRKDCRACAQHQFQFLESDSHEPAAITLCGRQSVHITPGVLTKLNLSRIAGQFSKIGKVKQNAYLLQLQLNDQLAIVLFGDGRAIIQGTEDSTKARSIYAELLGI